MLKGKHILLGITGSIAAYKSILLVRELVKLGVNVKVICTPSALEFVTPLTLSTLSKNPVYSSFIKSPESGEWVNHVELGKWADLMLIAPLSASTLSKMCSGQCDNLLLATYLSTDCPVVVAPAMDLDMHQHWTTVNNLRTLEDNGVGIIDAQEGELASGLHGKGRMAEVDDIVQSVKKLDISISKLEGKRVLITAGPTHEPIDPVRFIGNHSSGKMGFSLAHEASKRGSEVVLIAGPTHLTSDQSIERVDVISAKEMLTAVSTEFQSCDILIMSAAVADFTPSNTFTSKQKKENGDWIILS